ncbi:MAG: putative toxin-antitoxin system toxin component, PIN family [Micromonosporaceae bacterium]|nr:putative toxin-antitoxin system toxin component, PIN family [Micromonosporaceae bacterium]
MALRIVVDPNVWIAALITDKDDAATVLVARAVLAGDVTAVVSPHLLAELASVLARPKLRRWITPEDAAALVSDLTAIGEPHADPADPPARCRDPKDDYLVALAEAAGALLVTGDGDLLEMEGPKPPTVTPRGLLELLRP